MKTASERGKANRRKGATFERQVSRWLKDHLGIEAKRNLKQYQAAQHGDLDMVGPYLIECKNHARLSVKAWWLQAVESAKARDAVPCLIYKTRGSFRVVLPDPSAWKLGQPWRWDYEFTVEGGPAWFAYVLRESL